LEVFLSWLVHNLPPAPYCQDGWEDKWFIYVENGMYGNLSSWYGDPGPQGMWKVEPWNIGVGNQGAVQDQISNTLKELPVTSCIQSIHGKCAERIHPVFLVPKTTAKSNNA
jgi:hypothetical protein